MQLLEPVVVVVGLASKFVFVVVAMEVAKPSEERPTAAAFADELMAEPGKIEVVAALAVATNIAVELPSVSDTAAF